MKIVKYHWMGVAVKEKLLITLFYSLNTIRKSTVMSSKIPTCTRSPSVKISGLP